MSTEYTDADLINAYVALETEREKMVEIQKRALQPFTDAIAQIKGEMLARLQARGAKNVKVEGAGTAYTQDHLSVKVDNVDTFMTWVNADLTNRYKFLDIGVLLQRLLDAIADTGQRAEGGVERALLGLLVDHQLALQRIEKMKARLAVAGFLGPEAIEQHPNALMVLPQQAVDIHIRLLMGACPLNARAVARFRARCAG